jgi:hypothetical protein
MSKEKITFSDLLTAPTLRWPKSGDRLFAPAPDGLPEAKTHSDGFTRFVFMIDGYKRAADILVDEANSDKLAVGELVYPIVFCYRQFIELSLKWQIVTYGSICGIPKPKRNHDLKLLFETFEKICKNYDAADDVALAAVGECILEFQDMDPQSFTFRYSTDNNGRTYLMSPDRIDLERLKDVMGGIQNFFRGCDGFFNDAQGPVAEQIDPDEYFGF